MAKDVVGVGVIGTGFGVRVQLPVWSKTPGAKVTAVCSHDPARARAVAERFGIPHAITDYRELAELRDVDLVSVATPPYQHHPATMAALAAGKHVLCEKPFAMNEHEAREMLDTARAKGVLHAVNYEFRTVPARAEFRRRFQAGDIGSLSHVHVTAFADFVQATQGRLARWWFDSKAGGGWLGASGSHTIDTLRFLFGEIAGVSAQLDTVVKHPRALGETAPITSSVDDTFFLLVRFASGPLGAYLSGAAATAPISPMRLEAHGSEGSLVLEGDRLFAARRGERALREVHLPEPAVPPEVIDPHYVPFALWTRQIIEAVRTGKRITPDFEDGLRSQQVIDAARRSDAEGRWVEIRL